MGHPVLLYDGVCRFCNRLVQFILRHDRQKVFRFASLQSSFAAGVLVQRGCASSNFNTAYILVLTGGREELLERSAAVLFVMRQLGGIWQGFASVGGLIPRAIRDWAYDVVARNRYRVFRRQESCPLPSEADRDRFLDI